MFFFISIGPLRLDIPAPHGPGYKYTAMGPIGRFSKDFNYFAHGQILREGGLLGRTDLWGGGCTSQWTFPGGGFTSPLQPPRKIGIWLYDKGIFDYNQSYLSGYL